MTTVEKLLVQIFERNKSILEQVKKQTELFDQHLASKCVLGGIAPPPWLLSPSFASLSLHPDGLKKEELISGLLLSRSQPPSFYRGRHPPHHEKPLIPAANEVQPNCLEREVRDVNKVNDSVGRLSAGTRLPTTDTPCALNSARDSQDPDNCADHSRSLVRIERSKSRQRALETRNSARSAKLHANDENDDPVSCQNNVNSTNGEMKVVESRGKEGGSDHTNVRTQSGGPCQLSIPMNELFSMNKSSDIVKEDVPRELITMSMQQSNYADRMSEAASLTVGADEICATEEVNNGDCVNEVGSIIHSGGAKNSRNSSLQNGAAKEASDEVKSIHNGAKGGSFGHSTERSSEQANKDNRLQESVKPSSATFNRTHEHSNLQRIDTGSVEMGSKGDFVRVTRSMRSKRCHHGDEGVQLDYPLSNEKEDGCNSNRVAYHVNGLRDSIKPVVEESDLQSTEMRGDTMAIPKPAQSISPILQKDVVYDLQKMSVSSDMAEDADIAVAESNRLSQSTEMRGDTMGIPKPTQSISPILQKDDVYDLRKMSDSSNMAEDADVAVAQSNRLSQLLLSSSVVGQEVSYPEQMETHSNALACTVSTTIFDMEKCGAVPAETGINSPGLVEADSVTSRSNSGAHSIGVTSRSASENAMVVEPKQLHFGDMEVHQTSNYDIQEEYGRLKHKQSPAERHSACSSTIVTSVGHREQHSLLPNMSSLNGFDSQEKPRKDLSQDLVKDAVDFVDAIDISSAQEQTSIVFAQNPSLCSSFVGSWPQYKRIKVGDRPSYPCSTSSTLTTVPFQPFSRYNDAIGSDDNKQHAVEEMLQDTDNNAVQTCDILSSKLPVEEDEHTLGGRDRSENAAFSFMHEHLQANPLTSLTKLSTGSSEGSLSGQAKVLEPTRMARLQISHETQVFSPQVSDSVYLGRLVTESNMEMKNSDSGGNRNPPDDPVAAPLSGDSIAPDENVPELEKFVLETNDEEPSTAGNRTCLSKLLLPKPTLEHASILEQLSNSKFSYPNRLEHNALDLDLQTISTGFFGNLAQDVDTNKQFEASISSCLTDQVSSFTSHETYMFPTDNAHSIQGSCKVYISPIRKFWEPMPLKSLSSERRASSIPDLPSIDEEEPENMDDASPQNAIKTVERKPLADITESENPPASVCDEDEVIDDRCSLASVCTEFSVATSTCNMKTGNRSSSRSRYGYAASNTGKSKQQQQQQQPRFPLGVKRNDGSLQNRLFSKPPKLSRKNELRKVGVGLLDKERRHNNIVSNVTSFVPLVQQQKQMAAAVTGKRDVKVKALEAAEAAKRLAEKKENDRRLKKEALKLERARLDEQNSRQLELEKERKEEEQKKKEAEMAAKKRQREEEQKKERERKRKRVEDTRRQNMEQRDKKNNGNKEETKCGGGAPDVKACKLKEKSGEDERTEKAIGTKNPSIGHAAYDTRSRSSVDNSKVVIESQICKGKENNNSLDPNVIPEESYEISPYKLSDDEEGEDDDDDDDKPNTKLIPSWSRRSGIKFTVLSEQAKIDPATIFPLESFVSKDQVVLPRKLRHL